MALISWPRRTYEAAVLLVPLESRARTWLEMQDPVAMSGISLAADASIREHRGHDSVQVPGGRRRDDHSTLETTALESSIYNSDVVVLLTHDLAAVDRGLVTAVGDITRLSGALLGAVVVSPGARWDHPDAYRAAVTVRDAADNLIILKDGSLVLPLLQVLRGGVRDGEPVELGS